VRATSPGHEQTRQPRSCGEAGRGIIALTEENQELKQSKDYYTRFMEEVRNLTETWVTLLMIIGSLAALNPPLASFRDGLSVRIGGRSARLRLTVRLTIDEGDLRYLPVVAMPAKTSSVLTKSLSAAQPTALISVTQIFLRRHLHLLFP
jgi:hypothetical protein